MRTGLRCAIMAAVALTVPAPGFPILETPEPTSQPTAIERLQTIRESLRKTHAEKNATHYLRNAVTMRDFLNGSPNSILQLAVAQLYAGKDDDAVQSFSQFVRMGQSSEVVLGSKQFDGLRVQQRYPALHAEMIANAASRSVATKVFGLPDAELLPEDIDYDATTRLFYITSVLKKEIIALDMAGNTRVFASGPDMWPMMAVKVDARRHLLWATEVALDGFSWSPSEDWGKAAILLYDLKTGKLRWPIEGPARLHWAT